MSKYTPHPTAIAIAKRVSRRDPKPSDLGLALVEKRLEAIARLRSIIVTAEYNKIANAIFPIDEYQAANPTLHEGGAVEFYVSMSGLKRWDDPRLTDFLTTIATLDPDDSTMKEFKDYYNRDYKWEWKFQGGLALKLNLQAYEDSKTSECRRVQVGTKTVEQPVYRYDCVVPEGSSGELPAPVLALNL